MSASPVFGTLCFLAGAALTAGVCLACVVVVADVEDAAGVATDGVDGVVGVDGTVGVVCVLQPCTRTPCLHSLPRESMQAHIQRYSHCHVSQNFVGFNSVPSSVT